MSDGIRCGSTVGIRPAIQSAGGPEGVRNRARRHARPACASLALAFALLPVAGHAQDNDGQFWLERKNQIVVSATRTPLKVEDVPLTISVKTAEDIADELVTDIRDLVRFEPGVSVQRQPARFNAAGSGTGRAGNEGFNIRGIGGNRVLIQVDGVRVPDGFSFGAQAVGRGDYVDLGLVKSVEILRGPASALYGSDGLSGAVSFVTADPADFLEGGKNFGGLVRAGYASADNEFSETAILAGRSGDWSAMLAYTRRDHEELDNKGDVGGLGAERTKPNPQDGRSNAVLGRIVYEPAGGHKLRLTGEYLDTRLSTEGLTGRSATVELLEAVDTGERKRLGLDWSWEGNGTIDFARAAIYWQNGEDVQFTDEDRTPAVDRERLNTFENRVFGAAADARADFITGAIGHRLVFGADASITRQRGLRDGTVPPMGEVFPTRAFPSTDFTRAGAFVADEISIAGGQLMLYPALRFDYYKLSPDNDPLLPAFSGAGQDGSRVSPKMGVVWKINDTIRLFGNYATGFKAPEPGQVNQFFENLAFGYTSAPNPDLGPERSESFEGGIRIASNAVSLEMTAFTSRYKDFISQEVVGGSFTPADPAIYQFVNLDRVRVKGAEARFEARADNGLSGTLALSYAKGNEIDPDGNRRPLSTVDPLKLVMGVGYRDRAGRFGGQLIATHSAQKELGRTTGICTPACYRPGAFTILDATAFLKLDKALTLRAGIFNILDKKYAWWSDVRGLSSTSTVTDAYTQPGRNASVSASYRF
ncbi:TonB-dependent hemoglobin/transferrin/lactoferrin family receptor [Sphingomonas sp. C3-2]|uniref:TonB-dependent hemoglobin/transferrin/lactoferrin family receptor n=1 Tax=Sphingomonas sp. C3-2 TaxID=3062169 RepID=UPI00294B9754|nr:TonB-dependent hemoglobin/transferrin/lactoferrin family receptor [Sphingomonas sp. C3-2]WOK37220.1 TonB-dependent hemoglobin/transferrin/lactoferrin family receptor [Sphingomonas sp. C3-2]